MQTFRLVSWNVNGIRAAVRKGFVETIKKINADAILLQEVKINDEKRAQESFDFADYTEYWNSAKRPGYAGTAILLKEKSPLQNRFITHTTGIGRKEFDNEGRVQTLEFDKFYLVNAYFPHTRHDLSRFNFKLEFDNKYLSYIKRLNKKKPVIAGGDFNVAHEEIDLARPKDNIGNPGFIQEERDWATKLTKSGFFDSYRHINGNKVQYTWWSYRFNVRARNIGWRIDYFFTSDKLRKRIENAYIKDKILGSDHCPIGIDIKL